MFLYIIFWVINLSKMFSYVYLCITFFLNMILHKGSKYRLFTTLWNKKLFILFSVSSVSFLFFYEWTFATKAIWVCIRIETFYQYDGQIMQQCMLKHQKWLLLYDNIAKKAFLTSKTFLKKQTKKYFQNLRKLCSSRMKWMYWTITENNNLLQ